MKEKVQQAKKDLVETEIDIEEADAPKVHSRVYTPSPEEFNKHCATHLPYRNWCPICVKAKRKNPSHRKTDAGQHKHVPVLSMDYMFMNEKTDDYNFPILVLHDSESERAWAIFVKRKGNYSEYVSKRIAEIVNWLGYTKVVFKTDQEPAIKDVMHDAKTKIWKDMDAFHEQVKTHCACQITVLHSPVGESQANGVVENAIQRIQGQIRAIKLDVESSSDTKMVPTHPAWPWMIEFAAQSILYWRISGDDGLTAIQRIRGRSTTSPKPRFGEKILYKLSKIIKLGKSEARWRYGIWLGSVERSDERLVGTDLGVIKCRAVAPLSEDKRFDARALENMKGKPWRPSTKNSGSRIRTHIKEDDEEDGSDEDEEGERPVEVNFQEEEDSTSSWMK
ncbi:MAG: hypothetical protein NLN65_06160 [Candidatus Poseidoniaceae archaeon]|nr:hypothetical protein [Candidatus Poseidoniaceae archaeon]